VIERGQVCWVEPGAGNGHRFAAIVVQADPFNRSRIPTVLVVPLANNLRLVDSPGNVLVAARSSGLGRETVANVAQVLTLERRHLRETSSRVDDSLLDAISSGLELVLGL